jgi:gliding motility-associated-like protein
MKIQQIVAGLIVLSVFALVPSFVFAQISSDADAKVPTEYSSGSQDEIHIFCGKKGETNASLTTSSPDAEPANFEWLKYNPAIGDFDPFPSNATVAGTSTISNLADGCYRVIITSTSGTKTTFTAWVLNNYLETTAEIPESDCISFTLKGTIISPTTYTYIDLTNGQTKVLNKDIQVKWMDGGNTVSKFLTDKIYDPPTKDTDYTLHVSDISGCFSDVVVRYISIVTKASFTYLAADQKGLPDPTKKEAPLTVTFTNTSENGDHDKYQWFIFKDRDEIVREAAANPGKTVDSIMTIIYSDNPIYVFEKPGSYNVKLVSQKQSEFTTCYKTAYIDKFIEIQESFIKAPNFFTPNGDGTNETFVVQFISMKTVKISIFNRWGKIVHVWESNNVQGFGATVDSVPQSVWDGKVGGKMAVPGVYYYVAEGIGRDDKKRSANGFFHLFRGK